MFYSNCRACTHFHDGRDCSWLTQKSGKIKLRLLYSDSDSGLWGIQSVLHDHFKDKNDKDVIVRQNVRTYSNETFEYDQEIECGCRYYIPSDNLEYVEWKYNESTKPT